MSDSINAEFEAYVKAELGDIAVVSEGRYISPKIQNYFKVWRHKEVQADAAWQPIETAPKNGKESLFYTHEIGLCVMYWDDFEQAWGTGFDDEKPTPTHWMYLPKPPIAGEATEQPLKSGGLANE